MKLRMLAASLTLLVTTATSTNAALTVYTDRASFQAALTGGFITETFDNVLGEPNFRTAPVTIGSLTFQGSGDGQTGRNFIDQPPFLFANQSVDGTPNVNGFLRANSSIQLSFANLVYGFGADFADLQSVPNSDLSRIQVGSEEYTPTASTGVRFLGFISTVEFSSVNFLGLYPANSGLGDGFGMDNVTFASRS